MGAIPVIRLNRKREKECFMKQIIIVLLLAGIPLLYVTCDNAVSSIENTAAPAWTAAPTVEAEAGGYTITAGTATGSPEPLVSYYVAPDGAELPTDVTSETAWTEKGFSAGQCRRKRHCEQRWDNRRCSRGSESLRCRR